jgi:hypothetical protein
MSTSPKFLTPFAIELQQCIGYVATIALCESYGGQQIKVPEAPVPDSRLVLSIGWKSSVLLCHEYGPGKIYVPMLTAMTREMRNRSMRSANDNGQSPAQLAIANRMSVRNAHRIVGKKKRG